MYTKCKYRYTDLDGNTLSRSFFIDGAVDKEEIQPYLTHGAYFIPSEVSLPDLRDGLGPSLYPRHECHRIEGLSITNEKEDEAPCLLTAEDFVELFRQANEHKWNTAVATQQI
jgi:hypothetical protein